MASEAEAGSAATTEPDAADGYVCGSPGASHGYGHVGSGSDRPETRLENGLADVSAARAPLQLSCSL
ncbi:hypothetical protein EYF80_063032 [Liparis tanakae]|uniref:Uncharacterized protein n=1 Tax=Liparis tanakae TaxID=230148 RepID=A0A4Z2EDK2_9TELE|nr:hypothetical protein EYF80_063032 [Liparis tanakae]